MNIRGTDPAAIATVTDLFVVAAPARDEGANEFQRALQPPPAQKSYASSTETHPPTPREEQETEAPTSPSQRAETAEDQDQGDVEVAAVNEVTQAANEPDELPLAEDTEEQDIAAESLAAAANQTPQPQTPPKAEQVPAEVLTIDTASIGDETGAAAPEPTDGIATTSTAEQVQAALPREELAATVDTQVNEQLEEVQELIPEVATSTTEEEPAGDIGVPPSAAVTTTAGTEQALPTRQAANTRGSQDRSVQIKQATTSTGETSPAEVTAETPTEPDPGSQLVNDEVLPDKRNSKKSPDDGEAFTQTATSSPSIDAAATATVKNDALAVEPANQATPDAAATANQQHDPPTVQPAPSSATAAIVSRLPAQALVRQAASATQESAPLHVDAARFLQRVTKAFQSAHERGGEIRLRLSPPELGALRVEVNMQDQGLVARLEVETNEARALLLENLPVLRERLAEQGLRLERFDVDLAKREPEQQGGHLPDQPRDRQSQPEARQAKIAAPRQPTSPNTTTIPSPTAGWPDRQLNVIV